MSQSRSVMATRFANKEGLVDWTVGDMQQFCIIHGFTGYSSDDKEDLIQYIMICAQSLWESKTTVELKEICRRSEVKGFSGRTKPELIDYLKLQLKYGSKQ